MQPQHTAHAECVDNEPNVVSCLNFGYSWLTLILKCICIVSPVGLANTPENTKEPNEPLMSK